MFQSIIVLRYTLTTPPRSRVSCFVVTVNLTPPEKNTLFRLFKKSNFTQTRDKINILSEHWNNKFTSSAQIFFCIDKQDDGIGRWRWKCLPLPVLYLRKERQSIQQKDQSLYACQFKGHSDCTWNAFKACQSRIMARCVSMLDIPAPTHCGDSSITTFTRVRQIDFIDIGEGKFTMRCSCLY